MKERGDMLPPPAGGRVGEGGSRSITYARRLRKNSTLSERILWKELRGNGLDGMHFRRQHPIGPFIVDFCCVPVQLVVEIDGYIHTTAFRAERDAVREDWLKRQGFTVCRFTDAEVRNHIERVLETILEAGTPPSLTLPPAGGGE
jgi:very-short-patch-repair endonuclease